jgi:hypothetical protein
MNNDLEITNITETKITPIITLGWDIRPSIKGYWWLLRTSLRSTPILDIKHLNRSLSVQHLEFHFIQFVVFPQQLTSYNKYISSQ